MKYLITGYKGQLGYDIKRELLKRNIKETDILAVDKEEMDITNEKEVNKIISTFHPDVIFHCAAFTAVDKAEEMGDSAYNINVIGTKNIVNASLKENAVIVYMSTDYIFDGTKDGYYTETDKVNPKSVYGKTKYLGEEEVRRNKKHFITRISWVFGINGNNFVKTMLKLSETNKTLNVVNDQIGSPTYTVDLAKVLVDMVNTDKYGTYNVTNEGICSWALFAKTIFNIFNKEVEVNEVSTLEYLDITKKSQAYRPKNSKFSKDKLEKNGFTRLPSFEDALKRYKIELTKDSK